MKFRSSILGHFGIEPKEYHGMQFKRAAGNLAGALNDGLFIALIGGPGTGKKTLIRHVMDQLPDNHEKIYVQVLDDTRITISQIMGLMINKLSYDSENPRRDAYAKKVQLARLLGKVTNANRKVSVIIEQAQHLHHATMRALKELRELSFLGQTEMFGVLLSGHKPLKGSLMGLNDVSKRIEIEELSEEQGWMTLSGRMEYLKGRFGDALTANMRKQVALKNKSPLEIDSAVYSKMKEVYLRGDETFKESDFMLDLKEMVEAHGLSYQKIAEVAGYKKSTISQVINDKYDNPETIEKVKATIAKLTGTDQQLKMAI